MIKKGSAIGAGTGVGTIAALGPDTVNYIWGLLEWPPLPESTALLITAFLGVVLYGLYRWLCRLFKLTPRKLNPSQDTAQVAVSATQSSQNTP